MTPSELSSFPPTLGQFVAVAARRYGPNPALIMKPGFRSRITTYQHLDELAMRIGRYLQQQGVGKGDRVVLWAPNMPEWVQLFFGCHKVGAIPVPLDVRSSPDFVRLILRSTEARLTVLSRVTARTGEGIGGPTVFLEQLEAELPVEPVLLEDVAVAEDDLAEIMFTSGTTGDPKGVMLSHRNILSNVLGANQVLPIKPSFRLLSLLPLSHMLEQTAGLLAPLSGGAQIVYPVSRQPSVLFRAIAENQITMLILVPQALQLFLNAIEREARRQAKQAFLQRLFALAERLPYWLRRVAFRSVHARFGGKLDLLVCGGAYLDPQLARKWELMGLTVLQGYGATEAAPVITCAWPNDRKTGAVGKPFPGVEVRVADDGEVLARGPNIFRGYWENAEATAKALRDGWYYTGDLGYLDEDGFLHLKGRKKDLIVLANGQKVYPEDIEAELGKDPGVAEGVVVGLEGEGGAVEVHAVLLMREQDRAAEAVRAANGRLADHQQIQGFTLWPLEDFPRTHTLKVKKREVLDYVNELRVASAGLRGGVDGGDAQLATRNAQPETPPLHRLIGEIASVPVAQVQSGQTLGGDLNIDSLGRVELLSAIEAEMGSYVDEAEVSPGTTVRELEQLIAAAQGQRPAQSLVTWPLRPLGRFARELALQLVLFPLCHLFWRVRVIGRERLAELEQPALIVANHHFGAGTVGLDPAAAWMGLPRALRLRTCTAGEAHSVFDAPVKGFLAWLLNAFPLSKEGNVRASLEYVGRLLDLGWSVLIFPEGKLTLGGPLQPFMAGTGLMAVEGGLPVVPMWIEVERKSVIQGSRRPWRGAFTVRLGEPLAFRPGTSYAEATQRIEEAVRGLSAGFQVSSST